MNNAWWDQYLAPILTLFLFVAAFSLYYKVIYSGYIQRKFARQLSFEAFTVRWNLFTRLLGFGLFGVLPGLIMLIKFAKPLSQYGMNLNNQSLTLYWILGLSSLAVLVNYFAARSPQNLKMYPQIRIKRWNGTLITINSLSWMAYLLGYEFMFRGILLFGLLPYFDLWIVIGLNALLYSLAHIPKGRRETLAAFPFGILLCIICLEAGNLWIAFFVHSALALSNDMFSVRYQTKMEFVR